MLRANGDGLLTWWELEECVPFPLLRGSCAGAKKHKKNIFESKYLESHIWLQSSLVTSSPLKKQLADERNDEVGEIDGRKWLCYVTTISVGV